MDLGNKIFKLRKELGFSQEELAEKLGVTRQTISKWELGETTPDIKQAKSLSKVFNISLDELTGNDVNRILVEKVSNTEKLAGIIIKILKVIGVVFVVFLIVDILSLFLFGMLRSTQTTHQSTEVSLNCYINDDDYLVTIATDGYYNCSNCSKKLMNDIKGIIDYSNMEKTVSNVNNYFSNNNGFCE